MGTVELEVGEADHEAREGVPALHLHHALPPRAPVVVQRDLDIQCTVKSVCVRQPQREAQKAAAYGRWLLNRGEYQYKINIWEHFDWLLKTGWLLNRGDR